MKKTSRQIYFYELKLAKIVDGNLEKSSNFSEDIKKMLSCLNFFDYNKDDLENSRYLKKSNGTYDFVDIDEITETFIKGKLINADYSGLTYYEEHGVLKLIREILSNNASVSEVSHFIINIPNKIMAFEYNSKCSHASSLANYLNTKSQKAKTGDIFDIRINNMQNINKQKRFNSIKKVDSFKFTTSSKFILANSAISNQGIFSAVNSAYDLTCGETDINHIIKIEMKRERAKKGKKRLYFNADSIKDSINKAIENCSEESENPFQLDIVGYNELNEEIRVNYFKDFVVGKIILEENKVESQDFYEKIMECYLKTYNKYIK